MAQIEVTRDLLIEDSVFILQCLRQNQRGGRSNALAEVQQTLANSVTLDLSDYVAFLRRFGYVDVDARAAALQLTPVGDQAAVGEAASRVAENVGEHFAPLLAAGRVEVDDVEEPSALDELLRSAGLTPPQRAGATDPDIAPALPEESTLVVRAARLETAEGELGQGALSRVRAARHGELGRTVAVKQWKPLQHWLPWLTPAELGRRVLAEARLQAQLGHPCVMPILDVQAQRPEGPLLVMPIAPGGSLRARLAQRISVLQVVRAAAQVAHALQQAHAAGLVHTAVKPENVLLDGRGNALLSDFGTLRLVAAPASTSTERAPRVSVDLGDAAYRAPELSAACPLEPTADAYAFGVLLYELLTGQVPGRRSPVPSLVRPEVPRELDDLIDALLEDDPARRPTLATAAAKLALAMGSHPLYLL
jgi:tRNA A-37 threonylcarbamoyl transferase component Bud32